MNGKRPGATPIKNSAHHASSCGGSTTNKIDIGAAVINSLPISGRTGAIVMKTVSIFLTSGRKASINIKKQNNETTQRRNKRIKNNKMTSDNDLNNNKTHQAKIIESLKKKTKFSRFELEALCKIYKKLITIPGQKIGGSLLNQGHQIIQTIEGIDRTIFRELLHNTFNIITEDALIERIFCCWDRECEGAIKLESWIIGLDMFLRGSFRDKIEFCFRVYDLNGDGYITKDEMFQLFKNCLIKQPGEEDPDEGVKDLSELALKKLDIDHDGKVSFEDYETAIIDEPLLLEAFGQCLPSDQSCAAFLTNISGV